MVTFGEVARNVKNTVDRETCDLDRYIAGEHMKTDDLHIREWGTIGDDYLGPAFHRKFKKGQILYGSRRTYLRKVAIAPFDGICANTTFVIEPNDDVMNPDLLPFLMQSEGFTQYSIQNSKGSTNPYIIWRDLDAYTFPLPPIDEQRRIAEILWAAEDVIVKNEAFVAEVEHYKQLMMRDLFSKGIGHEEFNNKENIETLPRGWKDLSLGDVLKIYHGYAFKSECFSETITGKPIVVGIGNFCYSGGFRFGETRLKEYSGDYPKEFELHPGDILLAMTCQTPLGEILGVPGIIPNDGRIYLHNQRLGKVELTRSDINRNFLYWLFVSKKFNYHLWKTATGTKVLHTSPDKIESFTFGLPPLPEQRQIAAVLSSIDDAIVAARASVEASKALKMRLINQLLSEGDTV